MSQGAFEKLEGQKAKKFIDRLNKAWAGSPFDADRTAVHARSLPFADDWTLAEAGDATSIPEKRCIALDNGKECVPVRFDATFIPSFAAQNGFRIDEDTGDDYLRFWFEYARNPADRFVLIESVDDMPWREEPTPQARKSLAKSVMPIALLRTDNDGVVYSACVLFRDTLFDCQLKVKPSGEVEVVNRHMVAEGLTVSDPLTGL